MSDDDLRTTIRDFKASVSKDVEAQHRRLNEFTDEWRERTRTMETAILNEIRDLRGLVERRLERIETRLASIEGDS